MTDNSIIQYAPSQNRDLANALTGLEASLLAAAQANVALVAADGGYSQTEIQAMVLVDQLKQVNGLDLAAILLRAKYIRQIEATGAINNHPGGYQSRDEMARGQAISPTELSHTMDLVDYVFPYMQDVLGMNIPQAFEEIGKSNLKELIPTLKAIITGIPSPTTSVQNSVETLLDDVAATALAAGQLVDGPEIRRRAVAQLLDDGAHLTNRELRRTIRPERTPSINVTGFRSNGQRTIIATVSEEQWVLLQRRMGTYMDEIIHNLPEDPLQRQIEMAGIAEVRDLLRLMEG
jgi:hypothetical protein